MKCGYENDGENLFCISCGEQLPEVNFTGYCKFCGEPVDIEKPFCSNCGKKFDDESIPTEVTPQPVKNNIKNNKSEKSAVKTTPQEITRKTNEESTSKNPKKKSKVLCIVLIIIFVILLGVGALVFYFFDDICDYYEAYFEIEEETDYHHKHKKDVKEDIEEPEDEQENIISNNLPFAYVLQDECDYDLLTDLNNYDTYYGSISEFQIAFPKNFFSNSYYEINKCELAPYGDNVESVIFQTDDSMYVVYRLCKRTDSNTLEDELDYIAEYYDDTANDGNVIISETKSGTGVLVYTGHFEYTNYLGYYLIRITDDYIMSMEIEYLDDGTNDLEKQYMTECLYRMCGFSGSSQKPRTFEEFCAK